MKKTRIFAVLAAMAMGLAVFGCKAETETEYEDKVYAEAVTFTAEDAGEAGVKVAMATKTEGAAIYYTIDKSSESLKYSEPLTFSKDTEIKAFAVKEGIENSPISVAKVSIRTKTITEKVYVCAKCQKEYNTAQEAIDCCAETLDTTAPADVTELAAAAKDSSVVLTWKDATDEDIFGYLVSWKAESTGRALVALEKDSLIAAKGQQGCVVTGLKNGTKYTFTVKTMDTSGNTSGGVTVDATKTYSVGDSILIDGIDYTVLTTEILVSGSVKTDLINTEMNSLKMGLNYLHRYFDDCIVALRNVGKFSAYQDYKNDEEYLAVYNAVVPKEMPAGYEEKDFFEWTTNSSNKSFYYRDIYVVLDKDLNQIGKLQIIWSSLSLKYLTKGEEKILFSEAFKNVDILTLRTNFPEEYKISSTAKGLETDIYSTSDGVIYSQQEIIDDFRYLKKEKYPKAAASIWKHYNRTTGEWEGSGIFLHGIYGSEVTSGMLGLSVRKNLNYDVTGASGGTIEFDEQNHFKAENIEVINSSSYRWNTSCTKYDDSGLPYCADIRSVPIEFEKKEDGTIDFGDSVYEWAKKWRNFVVENNESASYFK